MFSRGNVTRGDELGVKERRRIPSAKHAVEPPCCRGDGLALARAEIVARARDADQVDTRIVRRDPLENCERTELVIFALDDERRTHHPGQRRLVARPRTLPWRDRMTEDGERIGGFALGKERAHAAPERTADQSDALVSLGAEQITRRAEIVELRDVVPAR